MVYFGNFKFWRNVVADEDDSYFDLVFEPPPGDGGDVILGKNDSRDVSQTRRHDVKVSKPASPLRQNKSFKLLFGLGKSSKSEPVNCELKASPLNRSPLNEVNGDQRKISDAVTTEKAVTVFLKLLKPMYGRASKKVKSSDFSSTDSPLNRLSRNFSARSRVGIFKLGSMKLRKSRSVSGVGVDDIPPSVNRRTECFPEQSDRIQSAILHCKKSFNSCRCN